MECRVCEWLRFRQVMMFGTIQPGIAPEILFETLLTCLKKNQIEAIPVCFGDTGGNSPRDKGQLSGESRVC